MILDGVMSTTRWILFRAGHREDDCGGGCELGCELGYRLEDDCEDGREWLWRWLLGICELDCQDGYEVVCKRIGM